jgi:threonine 3-dehydrogenase
MFRLFSRKQWRLLKGTQTSGANPAKWQPSVLAALSRRLASTSETGDNPRVLITGGAGQLGRGLARVLSAKYGVGNVILSDILKPPNKEPLREPYIYADILDIKDLHSIIVNNNIDTVVHFSAILSAIGERDVQKALEVNITGFHNIIELCRAHQLKLFCPSTIGAFGPDTPKICPDLTVQRPRTVYGVSKVHMELLGEYYHHRYGLDFRSLRFPGVISPNMPGGGTTDYAIHIFYDILNNGHYDCFLSEDSRLPMIYIDDCLQATVKCLEAPPERFRTNTRTYNIQAVSFTPGELVEEMRKHVPDFTVNYRPDARQEIADSWPDTLLDDTARSVLDWTPEYDLTKIVEVMMTEIRKIAGSETRASTP